MEALLKVCSRVMLGLLVDNPDPAASLTSGVPPSVLPLGAAFVSVYHT